MNKYRSRLLFAVFLIFLLLIVGLVGYHFISGFSWVDALYMTVITATTVGFGEVHPLDDTSKLFTVSLIITNILIYGYGISIISEYIANGVFIKNIMNKRMENKIKKFKNHILLVGFGRNGKQALTKLLKYDRKVVIIDKNNLRYELFNDKNVVFINGDATNDEVLIKAGIERADAIISTLGTDTDNLFVVLSARQLNADVHIISKASNSITEKKLKLAGADKVILPHKIGGDYMASLLVTPDLVEFIQRLSLEDRNKKTNLVEISFNDCPVKYHNKTIASIDMRRKTGCTIIGFKTTEGEYLINPDPETKMVKGANIIVLGRPEQIQRLNKLFNVH